MGTAARRTAAMALFKVRGMSTLMYAGVTIQQATVVSMVHEVAVGAALAVRALGIHGVTVKLHVA
jgi:hypothetical protein